VLGLVITNTRPTLTVEDFTFNNSYLTYHEYDYGAHEVTISGRLYSAATQLAAEKGFYWAGYYLLMYDEIYELNQSLNVLVDAISGWELEFYNPLYGVEVPWFCDDDGYFSLTLPVQEDGYFFPEDISESGRVYAADAFDVSRPWQGSTYYAWMLYGATASFQWIPMTYEAEIEVICAELSNGTLTAQFQVQGIFPNEIDLDKVSIELFKDDVEAETEFVFIGYDAQTGVGTWSFEPFDNRVYEPWFLNAVITYKEFFKTTFAEAEYIGAYITNVTAKAFVTQLTGNTNDLTITVTEWYSDNTFQDYTKTFNINNNAADTYLVDVYKIYVDTKGNDQIRACDVLPYK